MERPRVLVAGPDRLDGYLRPYCLAVEAAGGDPVRAWPRRATLRQSGDLAAFAAGFAGLLLPGGVDVEPSRYGEAPHPELGATDAELDEVQIALARHALESGWPTLAICRGAQVLGVAAGGALFQDLPSQLPSAVVHRLGDPHPKDALAHQIALDPGSRLAALVGTTRLTVNSRHHQAIRDAVDSSLGPLRVVGRAPDGVVEAIESSDLPFLVGVQWHPENLVRNSAEARALFRAHVGACRHATCRAGQ